MAPLFSTPQPCNDNLDQIHILCLTLLLLANAPMSDLGALPLVHLPWPRDQRETVLSFHHRRYQRGSPLVLHALFLLCPSRSEGSIVSLATLWGLLAPLGGAYTGNANALYNGSFSLGSSTSWKTGTGEAVEVLACPITLVSNARKRESM